MAIFKNLFLYFSIVITIGITGCHDKMFVEETLNNPVFMSYEDLRSAVLISPPQVLQKPGKIYFKDHLIFVNEQLKGIHVIDNKNPENPEFVAFIKIPGNVDIAVRDDILLADSYIDLVAIDISNPEDIEEVGRLKGIFPPVFPPINNQYGINTDELKGESGVVIGWEVEKVLIEIKRNDWWGPYPFPIFNDQLGFREFSSSKVSSGGGGTTFGIGGSMARFTLYSDYLYAVDDANLRIINVIDPAQMFKEDSLMLTWRGLETIFQYENKLFFGTQTGMLVYDITDPVNPVKISEFNHIQSCDPVVVEGDLAYVTLSSGNSCNRGVDRLDIIDLSDITDPQLLKSYAMTNPHGLGIDDNTLFICDGADGLEIYNSEDPYDLQLIAHFPGIHAWDVIPVQGLLLMIGDDGFYQYDYSGPDQIRLISTIPVLAP